MPLISSVGRTSLRPASIIAFFYAILVAGALTMVYPFGLMLATSICSFGDYHEYRLVPRYLYDSAVLFKKYIVDKTPVKLLGYEYGRLWSNPIDIRAGSGRKDCELSPLLAKPEAEVKAIAADWSEFLPTCPDIFKFAYFRHTASHNYSVLDIKPLYQSWLSGKYGGDIAKVNAAYGDNAKDFREIGPPVEEILRQRWILPIDAKFKDWQQFKATLPTGKTWVVSAETAFQNFLRERFPSSKELKAKTGAERYDDINFIRAVSDPSFPRDIAAQFVKRKCPVIFLSLDPSLKDAFAAFLEDKYKDFPEAVRLERLAMPFQQTCPMDETFSGRANEWIEFMEQQAPLDKIHFRDPTLMWQDFLKSKYGSLEALAKAHGDAPASWTDIRLPYKWIDVDSFRKSKSSIFWAYLTGNYSMVFNVIAVHGRALLNTIIFIALSIAGALTVNPLAAYALSRFRLPYTNKILLFLLATMAFPHAVSMIPSFLLLRDLNMLNTFWALVLPGLANGFAIFLLKGFFDSLPQEIYEAALIDGAGELTIFARVTLPLTSPILAIITLNAFTHAYSAFMFAFLTCQDPKMWTLMVFLYEFQQMYPTYLVMASLVVSAIPTLMVFLFCQNIILRGIVVPSFK